MLRPRLPARRARTAAAALVAWAAVLVASAAAGAAEQTGLDVITRATAMHRSDSEVLESTLIIVSSDGLRRERRFRTIRKADETDDDKILIRFLYPADVKGSGLLTIEAGDADEQWLYLHEMGKSKRLAGGSKAGRFMGSDLSHADMRTENLAAHDYELVGEEIVGEHACYKVKATPKTDATLEETGYGARHIYVDKERWILVKVAFFDKEQRPLKTLVASGWTAFGDKLRSSRLVIENQQKATQTIVEHDQATRQLDQPIYDALFTRRALEKP